MIFDVNNFDLIEVKFYRKEENTIEREREKKNRDFVQS